MTQDDILRMAREAWGNSDPSVDSPAWRDNMARFAALVAAAAEREAIIQAIPGGHYVDPQWVCDMIRARSKE